MQYYVRLTKDMGRGVFAGQDLKAGDLVCYCELLVLSTADSATVNETALQYYTFKFNETQDCLVLGDGEIFNHSNTENVKYEIVPITDSIGTRHMMKFTATRAILEDEQMFINYAADMTVDTSKYTVSMVG